MKAILFAALLLLWPAIAFAHNDPCHLVGKGTCGGHTATEKAGPGKPGN